MSKIFLFLFIFGAVTIDLINACVEHRGACNYWTATYCCDDKDDNFLICCTNTWGAGTCEIHYTSGNLFRTCATAYT
ncbi:GSCOCT00014136001.2-RA-CDS [Cotesia congregata]|uniref:Venom protein 6 n=1 Tax=Cotesia congregata TaxID=51543 RepID=A0A8J2HNR6_COTCN|nr:GSCOCT00014136001.2-RA-CDS [Cotesia congregata]CAG5104112.1 Putative venom protein 6 [Cotesia congregata]